MPRQRRGILGVKKDPKNQILFFSRNGEEWPSDDSEDSDYLPSDIEDDLKRKKTQDRKQRKKKVLSEENSNEGLNVCDDVHVPSLPTEIWLKIFQEVVLVAGPLPFLCRAQMVCSHWKDIAEHPSLWRKVDLSYGWIKQKEETLKWLAENRLSQCEDINLSNWTLSSALRSLTERCPNLQHVNLSNCKKLTADGVTSLADNCTQLRDIDVSNTGISSVSLKDLLTKRCGELQRIDISHNSKLPGFSTVINTIMKCPELTVLDISNINNTPTYIAFDVEDFQRSCPKLKVLRMGNNRYMTVNSTDNERENSPGFPALEEFSFPDLTCKHQSSTVLCDILYRLLRKSPKLKVLDLRGRLNEAITVLNELPATELESFHVGHSSMCYDDSYMDLFLKWRSSLKTVDLSWVQNVELAIQALSSGPQIPLECIQLTGSNIVYKDLKSLLEKSPNLKYIQLESCRNLFRGIKRLYKDDDINILKSKLKDLGDKA